MEFDILNNSTKVEIKLTFRCGYAGNYIYTFSHDTGHSSHAGLIAETIYNQFYDHIKAIRESAYNQGWHDKQKRNKKRTDFDWCPDEVKMY